MSSYLCKPQILLEPDESKKVTIYLENWLQGGDSITSVESEVEITPIEGGTCIASAEFLSSNSIRVSLDSGNGGDCMIKVLFHTSIHPTLVLFLPVNGVTANELIQGN